MPPDPKTSLTLATKKAWTLLDEFKASAFKGNVVDLAIGVIIGGAFHNIVESLVKNVIMPLFAILIPGQRPYTHWQFTARGSTVHVGLFLGDIVHLLIMAAVLFLFLGKFLGWLVRTQTIGNGTSHPNLAEFLIEVLPKWDKLHYSQLSDSGYAVPGRTYRGRET